MSGIPGHFEGSNVPTPPILNEEGNCRGERVRTGAGRKDPWFPPDSYGKVPPISAVKAKLVAWEKFCATCPVLVQCLNHALKNEVYGIWAGTNDFDRREARINPELDEYMRHRAESGYIPVSPPICVVQGCARPVTKRNMICGYHRAADAKAAKRKGN